MTVWQTKNIFRNDTSIFLKLIIDGILKNNSVAQKNLKDIAFKELENWIFDINNVKKCKVLQIKWCKKNKLKLRIKSYDIVF